MKRLYASILSVCLTASVVVGDPEPFESIWLDPVGDAVLRPTDFDGTGVANPASVLPDLVSLTISGWMPSNPALDPYVGMRVESDGAHIFRIDLVLDGLVNPPGPLGLSGQPYDPYQYGPSPLYGYIGLDVDDDKDTGGQLGATAEQHFLANVGRFGTRPEGSLGDRAARSAGDYDRSIYTDPAFERSGEDFLLTFCGCFATTLVREIGNGDGLFDAGETMDVRSRFFVRTSGYIDASGMSGGSVGGAYDPFVEVRFSHDETSGQTTVTFVGPVTNVGYGLLHGVPTPPIDFIVTNGWSIEEGVFDLIESVPFAHGQTRVLIEDWEGEDVEDSLEPNEWSVTAIVGTAFATPASGLYIWTDVGFDLVPGDLDGDLRQTEADAQMLRQWVYDNDGSVIDADGLKDGVFTISGTPFNFSMFDLDGDGLVRHQDLAVFGPRADLDGDGELTLLDYLVFLNYFDAGDPRADFDLDERFTVFDLLEFQNAFENP